VPLAAAGGREIIETLFAPLGYEIEATPAGPSETPARPLFDVTLRAETRLADALTHLYVLMPVIDNDKHYWINRDEIDKLVAKGEGGLAAHPARDLIAKRALGHRREFVHQALDRLLDAETEAEAEAEPLDFLMRGDKGLIQPSMKVAGAITCASSTGPNTTGPRTSSACANAASDASFHSPTASSSSAWRGCIASARRSRSPPSTNACSRPWRSRANPSTHDCEAPPSP
jgi:hypothetical protein